MTIWDAIVRVIFAISFNILMIIAVSTAFQLIFCIPCIKLLNRKGENGFKFLIPVYGGYLFYKKTADNGILYWFFALCLCFGAMSYQLSPIFSIIFLILIEFFHFVFSVNLAAAYDKGLGLSIGLFLLPIVFYFVLAFSKETAPAEGAGLGSGDKEALAAAQAV